MNRVVAALFAALTVVESGCVNAGASAKPVDAPVPMSDTTPCHPPTVPISQSALPVGSTCVFYRGRNYGSEAQFNPITEVLNEGFDQLRVDNSERRLRRLRYLPGAKNVLQALIHPDSAMRAYGVRKAFTDELLPLSTKATNGGNWVPNYEFHLIGSGMVSRRMTEWYEAHDVPYPFAMSAVTMYTAHFINEALEDGGRKTRGHPFDPVADLYVFDLGGILMFRSKNVQNFFSKKVELTNWPGQATFGFPGFTLENAGQEFLLRTGLPRTDIWRVFFAFGISTLGGISYGTKGGTALSLASGVDAVDTPVVDSLSGKKTVVLKPNAGLFIDHDGSLLFSLTARNSKETIATANLYPGVVRVGGHTFGLWTQMLKNGRWRVGLVASNGIGIGTSAR